ncbi:PA14 domain-containing protein [Herbiconiux sp. CPCC 205763]|uniref:PA14 domain-containing protein n=1 Tax=Herbiconiux aconitum TaxID=2970913 RepID=A0ABT2GSM6_9MICO|nr:PA14 domain-containing protein [Herbiconiux aconitum]MCS5718562.1 PA14 domain-containing protein [Herbiconiux aconitum]
MPFVLSAITTIALIVGTGAPAWGAALEPVTSGSDEIVEPDPASLKSEASDPPVIDPVAVPSGDFSDEPDPNPLPAPEPATPLLVDRAPGDSETAVTDFDPDVAELVSRSEYDSTYRNADSTLTTVVSPEVQNVRVDGSWVPIETGVAASGPWSLFGIGGAAVERHPLAPTFAPTASDHDVLTLSRADHTIGFTLQDSADSPIRRDAVGGDDGRSHVQYDAVFPKTDLLYDVTKSSVKENLRLGAAPGSRGRVSWSWAVDADGLILHKTADGGVEFKDEGGAVVFLLPSPSMSDSSAVAGVRTSADAPVRTTVLRRGDAWTLTLSADRDWLNDPARVYPVLVDPTISTAANEFMRAYKSNGMTSNGMQVGNSNNGGFWRTVFHVNYEQFFGKQVIGAGLEVTDIYGDSSYDEYGVALSTATTFGYESVGQDLGGFSIGPSGGLSTDMRLQNKISEYVRTSYSGGFFTLVGDESPDVFTYKHVETQLVVNWKEYATPGRPGASSPANGAVNVSLVPKLSVQGATTDPSWQLHYRFRASTSSNPASDPNPAYDSDWVGSSEVTVPEAKLQPGMTYRWMYWVRDTTDGHLGDSTVRQSPVTWSFTTNTVPLTTLASAVPADNGIVVTTTPTLSVGTPAGITGRTMKYWFRIASGSDSKTGVIVSSGWQTGTTWTVPANFLQDGSSYTWTVLSQDQYSDSATPWVGRFRVNRRITDPGPAPTDSAGPVTVNLANGNAGLQFSSPVVSTAGGPLGMAFSYNSQKPSNTGLRGEYFDATEPASATPPFSFDGRAVAMVRIDPAINFNWALSSPTDAAPGAAKPLVPADRFLTRWTGIITLPEGKYTFGVTGDDGYRVWLDSTKVVDHWATGASTTWSTSTIDVPAGGRAYAFKFEYFEHGGPAGVVFKFKVGGGTETPVPAAWFTRAPEILPSGWGASNILAGVSGTYTKAETTEGGVKITDVYGTVHSYTKKSAGGYTPPSGEYGVVALDTTGAVTFTDDSGTLFAFNKDGSFASATSPGDVRKPTAPVVTYRPGSRLVDSVADPLSRVGTTPISYDRRVVYRYRGDSQCVVDAGFSPAPVGMLCQIEFPDSSVTKLQYDPNGYLVRIVNPGNEVVTFTYDSGGRMTQIRNALANDWLMADTSRTAGPANRTDITYDSVGRVSAVGLPTGDGVTEASRPGKKYTYASGTSYVDSTGLSVPPGTGSDAHAAKVTFNSILQATSSVTAEGLTAQTEWNSKDQALSSIDAQGLKTTTLYNAQDRMTERYGPAPASCFEADRRFITPCMVAFPVSRTIYDQGLQGLNVAYWDNESLFAQPKDFNLGLAGVSGGAFARDFGTASPISGVADPETWSLRGTGLIRFDQTGAYRFNVWADDAVRVYLDDVLVIDNWTYHGPAFVGDWKVFNATAGQTARIRIDYAENTGSANVQLNWWKPGAATWEVTPGSALTPDYGLETTSINYDTAPTGIAGISRTQVSSLMTSTAYANPWLGLATSSSIDPSGLNLTTQTVYESSGLYNRRIGKLSPADAGSPSPANGASYAYWPIDGTPTSANCGVSTSTRQYGMLKTATLSQASAETGVGLITVDYVYDTMGRVAGTKKTGDSAWSCVSYDARGRPTTKTSASLSAPIRTTKFGYASPTGDPLTTWVQDDLTTGSPTTGRITTVTNLLGQVLSKTDVWGTVTTTSYDILGRVTGTAVVAGGVTNTTTFTYSLDGRVETVSDNGKLIADPSYAGGLLATVAYPAADGTNAGNGTQLAAVARDEAGRDKALVWQFSGEPGSVGDSVIRSQAGRVIRATVADSTAGAIYTSTYSFDTAGRLTAASIPGHSLSYDYAGNGGCGSAARAGANGNRTRTSDTPTGGGGLQYSTSYCYDSSDRLTAAPETVVGAGSAPTSMIRPARSLAPTDIVYDSHGNMTKLGNQTFTYDSTDRHMSTTVLDAGVSSTVTYVRDVTGAIVARTETDGAAAPVTHRYSGSLVLSETNVIEQRTLSLPGGVTVSLPATGDAVWCYPNLHGDVTWTAGPSGVRTGVYLYDPFGQPIDLATMVIGSAAADESIPDTMPGSFDPGWVGSKGKGYEHLGSIATIEMGARMYSAMLGRFLAPDPVEGGNTGNYNYPNDPVNMFDLSGEMQDCGACSHGSYKGVTKGRAWVKVGTVHTNGGGTDTVGLDWSGPVKLTATNRSGAFTRFAVDGALGNVRESRQLILPAIIPGQNATGYSAQFDKSNALIDYSRCAHTNPPDPGCIGTILSWTNSPGSWSELPLNPDLGGQNLNQFPVDVDIFVWQAIGDPHGVQIKYY